MHSWIQRALGEINICPHTCIYPYLDPAGSYTKYLKPQRPDWFQSWAQRIEDALALMKTASCYCPNFVSLCYCNFIGRKFKNVSNMSLRLFMQAFILEARCISWERDVVTKRSGKEKLSSRRDTVLQFWSKYWLFPALLSSPKDIDAEFSQGQG